MPNRDCTNGTARLETIVSDITGETCHAATIATLEKAIDASRT